MDNRFDSFAKKVHNLPTKSIQSICHHTRKTNTYTRDLSTNNRWAENGTLWYAKDYLSASRLLFHAVTLQLYVKLLNSLVKHCRTTGKDLW